MQERERRNRPELRHIVFVLNTQDFGNPFETSVALASMLFSLPAETSTITLQVPNQPQLDSAFEAFTEILIDMTAHLAQHNIRFLNQSAEGPEEFQARTQKAEELTAKNTGKVFALRIGSDERSDLVSAVKNITTAGIASGAISEKVIHGHLPNPDIPDADLILYTRVDPNLVNGERILSLSGLAWRTKYAELGAIPLAFSKLLPRTLGKILDEQFYSRERRFGGRPSSNGKAKT